MGARFINGKIILWGGHVGFAESCCWCRCSFCDWGTIPDTLTITIAGVVGGLNCLDGSNCTGINAAYVVSRDLSSDCLWALRDQTGPCSLEQITFCLDYAWLDGAQWKIRAEVWIQTKDGATTRQIQLNTDINITAADDTLDCSTDLSGLVLGLEFNTGDCDWSTTPATATIT